MAADDVEETLQMVSDYVDVTAVNIKHRPRLLSDNGLAFVSQALKEYLQRYEPTHIRGAPYLPMTQGNIERYHLSMKNVVKLQNFYLPSELEQVIKEFITYYKNERYHESQDNMTPVDVYFGRVRRCKASENESSNRPWKSGTGSIDKASKTGYIGMVNPLLF